MSRAGSERYIVYSSVGIREGFDDKLLRIQIFRANEGSKFEYPSSRAFSFSRVSLHIARLLLPLFLSFYRALLFYSLILFLALVYLRPLRHNDCDLIYRTISFACVPGVVRRLCVRAYIKAPLFNPFAVEFSLFLSLLTLLLVSLQPL